MSAPPKGKTDKAAPKKKAGSKTSESAGPQNSKSENGENLKDFFKHAESSLAEGKLAIDCGTIYAAEKLFLLSEVAQRKAGECIEKTQAWAKEQPVLASVATGATVAILLKGLFGRK